MEYEIKVWVKGDITSCNQLRIQYKDREYSNFICGIDVEERLVLTTFGHIWSYSILSLVEDIARSIENRKEFCDVERVNYLLVCDDSSNLELNWSKCHEELLKNKDALHKLTWIEEENSWLGTITINK